MELISPSKLTMANKAELKKLDKLLEEARTAKSRTNELENRMFKLETKYIEITNGSPITKNIEFYLNNKAEKKRTSIDDSARIFAVDHPKPVNPPL